jgi:MHS family alpha-ketoglutarate permease-like MFS transporter
VQATTTTQRLRSIFGGSVGNLVEWYDWYVYSSFSLYFAKVFFPQGDRTAQLLNTAAIFAVGFLMRPIGGWLLGRHADRHGRKSSLVFSVLLMCAGSLLIAINPGYARIGVAAPALLVVARLLQGLSVGGEYGISATYLSEIATSEHRGFWSSFQYVTLVMGQLFALGLLIVLQILLTPAALDAWGWRVAFVIGAVCALIALRLRRNMSETDSFVRERAIGIDRNTGSMHMLFKYPHAFFTVFGLTLGGTLAFYTYTTYMQKFMVNTTGFTSATATMISAAALFVFMLTLPLFGALSDRIGRRKLLLGFGVFGALGTVPILSTLAHAASPWTAFWLILLALTIISGYTAVSAIVKAELFPVGVRATGVGLAHSLAAALFGGSAEYLALKCKDIGHETWFYWYVSAGIMISLLVCLWMPETRTSSRIDRDDDRESVESDGMLAGVTGSSIK